jgi:hypothetical protein
MSPEKLLDKLLERPFRPFRARLSDNSTIDVLYSPGSVVVGPTNAMMPLKYVDSEYGLKLVLRWKTVPLDQIIELENLDTK